MRRLTLLTLAVAVLPACASSSSSTPASRPATQTVGGGAAGSMTIANNSGPTDVINLESSADAVWRILPSVFDSVGITVNTIDQSRKTIGNPQLKIRQKLGKKPLSLYLDCGNSQIGPNADSYDVLLTVMSTVAPKGTGATLSTIVEAQAKPVTYNQAYSRCSSKGGIESKIAELVKARLSR